MNVTELARRVKMRTNELLEVLPEYGFDIGKKAIKVDDRVAYTIVREWPRIQREIDFKKAEAEKKKRAEEQVARQEEHKQATFPAVMSVKDFALKLQLPITTIMRELVRNGILAAVNDRIDFETASVIAEDLGYKVMKEGSAAAVLDTTAQETALKSALDNESEGNLQVRAPVIVVMGHVDHGKTKLLDTIRSTNVMAGEAGGITQHIGAYQVEKKGRKLTFIDTPGHEAFTVMRSRGARVADIAILVVAADDGVMPQTKEAINIIKAAKLPFVVALNKIDKTEANPERVKAQLSEAGVMVEDYGGDVPLVPISAKEGMGIDKLLEVLLLVADIHKDKIRANPDRAALGTVIDARVDKGEGPVATVLVQAGTLRGRDPLVVNQRIYGRVRAMKDFLGRAVKEAPPGTPVKILGFEEAPEVGDILDIGHAGEAEVMKKTQTLRSHQMASRVMMTTGNTDSEGETSKKLLPIFIKADTLGSLEAILGALEQLQHPEVGVKIAGRGLGNITEVDVSNALQNNTIVYAFSVVTTPSAKVLSNQKNLKIRNFRVIYDLINDVKTELEKMLQPEIITTEYGRATILKIFRQDKKQQILGGRLEDGSLVPEISVRIFRDGAELGEGKLLSLKMGKSEAKEIRAGQEFGMAIKSRTVLAEGDSIQGFKVDKKEKKIKF